MGSSGDVTSYTKVLILTCIKLLKRFTSKATENRELVFKGDISFTCSKSRVLISLRSRTVLENNNLNERIFKQANRGADT